MTLIETDLELPTDTGFPSILRAKLIFSDKEDYISSIDSINDRFKKQYGSCYLPLTENISSGIVFPCTLLVIYYENQWGCSCVVREASYIIKDIEENIKYETRYLTTYQNTIKEIENKIENMKVANIFITGGI